MTSGRDAGRAMRRDTAARRRGRAGGRRLARGAAALAGALAAAAAPPAAAAQLEWSGRAFGTTWRVRAIDPPPEPSPEALGAEIEALLRTIDAQVSSWRADSELSRFAAADTTGWWPVSADTARLVAAALALHDRSDGAFDPTVAPLVALWGFGPAPRRRTPPSEAEIAAVRPRVGAARIAVRADPPALRKARPDVALDLTALTEGFAVDAIARRLGERGLARHLVELGGELRASGAGPGGAPWRVGVERPDAPAGAAPATPGWVVALHEAALSTSGQHRQFFAAGGKRYAHVLDPRRGRPVDHALVSVSVIAPEAVLADGWATALLVLGPEQGPRVAEREALAALFVLEREGGLEVLATPGFARAQVR